MKSNSSKCFKCVGGVNSLTKYGKTKSGKQRYLCKKCNKTSILEYSYNAYQDDLKSKIILLTKEGLGIRSTARVLQISPTTLLKRIITIAQNIKPPTILKHQKYELDELRTFIQNKNKLIWIIYAINKENKSIVSFKVGARNSKNIKLVVDTLENSDANQIYTDKLNIYFSLIKPNIHIVKNRGINYIERKNLTLRTHLKRLNRNTLCFSKSLVLLSCVLKIYFWG